MITTVQHSIGTEAVLISEPHHTSVEIHVQSKEVGAGNPIYIGDAEVATNNGYYVQPNTDTVLILPAGKPLYAISNGNNRELHVLRIAD